MEVKTQLTEEQVRAFRDLHDPIQDRLMELMEIIHYGNSSFDEFDFENNHVCVYGAEPCGRGCCSDRFSYNIPLECLWRADGNEFLKKKVEEERLKEKREEKERERLKEQEHLRLKEQQERFTYETLKAKFERK